MVLILANDKDGLYNFRKKLIDKLKIFDNKIILAFPSNDVKADENLFDCRVINTPIDRRGINPFKDYLLYRRYKKIIKEIKPDVVITYTIKPNIYGSLAAKKKSKYFVNITGLGSAFQKKGLLKKIIILLYKKSLKNVEKVFFENTANKNIFIENNIIPTEKAVVLNGAGVDLQKFEYSEMIDSYPITFLFIGRIMKEKGINEFINAATKLKQEYQDKIKFEIIGNYEEDYKKELETLNDLDIISYYGFQHDVKPYIEKVHCIVLPSYHEGMSNSLLEAAAMGRPLIASDINGCKEAIIEGQSGYLCKVKDSESLYQKMKEYYNLPFENKQKMGQASRKHMEEMFDKNKIVEKTILNLLGN